MPGASDLVEAVERALPEARPILEEHVVDYGSVLPHVFMGEVTRLAIALARDPGRKGSLSGLLSLFERELEVGDQDAKDLILQSFVENLQGEGDAAQAMLPYMGVRVKTAVLKIVGPG